MTDNGIYAYFQVCFEEQWDSLYRDTEERQELSKVLETADSLTDWCSDLLDLAATNLSHQLRDAIVNSVDWDNLLEALKDYVKENED